MKNFSYKKLLSLSLILISSLFLLISCGGTASNVLPTNEDGYSLEDLAPYNSSVVISYGAYDQVQKDNFKTLLEKFELQPLLDKYLATMNEILAESDLTFEDDLKPMLGEDYRAIVAMDLNKQTSEPTEESDVTIELYEANYSGEMFIAFIVADVKKAEDFINALSKSEGMILGDNQGYLTVTDTQAGTQIILIDNFLVMTTTDDAVENALSRYAGDMDALSDNQNYLKTFGEFSEPQLIYAYFDLGGMDVGGASDGALSMNPFKLVDYQMYGVSAKEDGFDLKGFASFDKDEMKKYGADLSMFSGPGAYMTDYFNANDLIAYTESYDLANSLRNNPTLSDPSISEGFRSLFGSDLEAGLFSWMDKGFAFVLQKGDWLIPGITLAFDASSNSQAARDFYLKLDTQLSGYITLSQEQLGAAMQKAAYGDLSVISIDLAAFDDGSFAEQFPGVTPPSIDFTYGLTEDDLFILSIQKGLYENYGDDVISDNTRYDEAIKTIGDADGGVIYFDFSLLTDYFGEFAEVVLKSQLSQQEFMNSITEMSEEESKAALEATESDYRSAIAEVVNVLKKLDYFVLGSEITSKNNMRTAGYLKVK
ncbi:MAG: DUF3352 domain-containing protein [Candidatus Peregrinibacteria bacterium]|nr:DUF3352 domain-containing protein [Candidatus Peregrinibacteria bacterium]MDZ4245263.1 DUF3352 domain-containing protein [Candidatus Gracilibacteria bacterium]